MPYDCPGRKKRVFKTDFYASFVLMRQNVFNLRGFLKNYLLISVFTRFYYVQ